MDVRKFVYCTWISFPSAQIISITDGDESIMFHVNVPMNAYRPNEHIYPVDDHMTVFKSHPDDYVTALIEMLNVAGTAINRNGLRVE